MTITYTELFLLTWAFIATLLWALAARKAHLFSRFIMFILDNPKAYEELKDAHRRTVERLTREHGA